MPSKFSPSVAFAKQTFCQAHVSRSKLFAKQLFAKQTFREPTPFAKQSFRQATPLPSNLFAKRSFARSQVGSHELEVTSWRAMVRVALRGLKILKSEGWSRSWGYFFDFFFNLNFRTDINMRVRLEIGKDVLSAKMCIYPPGHRDWTSRSCRPDDSSMSSGTYVQQTCRSCRLDDSSIPEV